MGRGRDADGASETGRDGDEDGSSSLRHPARHPAVAEDWQVPLPLTHPVAVGALSETGGLTVELRPDAAERAAIAHYLQIVSVEALLFRAELLPQANGWQLRGRLAATVVQSCVVTLDPVVAEVATSMDRSYMPGVVPPSGNEIELDADADGAPEPLGDAIDVAGPMVETLALALDPFPRAEGAEHGTRVYGPPGAEPLTDEAARPFSGLAALKARLDPDEGGNGGGD
ncbi:MAG: DUF177 domain-containing protein [Pseudomonadota bacterium]